MIIIPQMKISRWTGDFPALLKDWKNPVMEIGTVRDNKFQSFEKKTQSTSFSVADHQKLCLILLADGETSPGVAEDVLIIK